jgi:hypothetical protein
MRKLKGFIRDDFKKWLKENCKGEVNKYNFEIYVDEAFKVYAETANKCYELGQFETKTGNAECFYW